MAETQKTDAGWRSQRGMRWAGRTHLCDVVDELERDGLGVDQSQARHESHVSLQRAIVRNFFGR